MSSSYDESTIAAAIDAHDRGDLVEATTILRRIADAEPLATTWALLGSYQLERSLFELALAAFERALELDPAHAPALAGMANALAKLGHFEEAERVMRQAFVARNTPYYMVLLGDIQLRLHKDEDAVRSFTKALELEPANEEAMYNLAVLARQSQPAHARELLEQAIAVDPLYAAAYRELALLFIIQRKSGRAVDALDTSLAIDPSDEWTHMYRGIHAWRSHAVDDARRDIDEARRLKPLWAMPFWLLARLNLPHGRDREPRVRSRESLFGTDDIESGVHVARLLRINGLLDEAEELIVELSELKPELAYDKRALRGSA